MNTPRLRYDISPGQVLPGFVGLVWAKDDAGPYLAHAFFGMIENDVKEDAQQYIDMMRRGLDIQVIGLKQGGGTPL